MIRLWQKCRAMSLWREARCGLLLLQLLLPLSECSTSSGIFLPDELSRYSHEAIKRDYESILIQQERDQELLRQHSHGVYDAASDDDGILTARYLQNDIAFCYDALYLADQNRDSKVDGNEFVTFVQIMGPPGFLPDADTFDDLPLIMQSNFIILACLCLQLSSSNPQCCTVDPHIDTTGTWPGQVPTAQQEQYLYQVCFLTETSIDRVIVSQTPTMSPATVAPTDPPLPLPTLPPVDPPTPPPTTGSPSTAPSPFVTASPSIAPTIKTATDAPTNIPTVVPTIAQIETPLPTTSATITPAPTPTFVITSAPSTQAPSTVVTEVPSLTPSVFGITTMGPSLAPSLFDSTLIPTTTSTAVVSPSFAPTGPPGTTVQPTIRPPLASDQVAQVNYQIALRNGNMSSNQVESSTYLPTLIMAMNVLAETVEEEWNTNQFGREQEEQTTTASKSSNAITSTTTTGGSSNSDGSNDTSTGDLEDPTVSRFGDEDNNHDDNRHLRRRRSLEQQSLQVVLLSIPADDLPKQQRRRRRRLAIALEVQLPTNVDGTIEEACPSFVPDSDSCQNIAASIPLLVFLTGEDATEEEAERSMNLFQQDMNNAIEEGRLQDALEQVDPNSVVYVTTGTTEVPPPIGIVDDEISDERSSEGLKAGAIAGIAAGAGAVMILVAAILSSSRRRGNKDETDEELLKNTEDKASAAQFTNDIANPNEEDEGSAPSDPASTAAIAGGALAATTAVAAISTSYSSAQKDEVVASTASSPGKKKRYSSTALYAVPGAKNIASDEGSSAGESGWSSNQDMSSIDSKSLDSGAGQMYPASGGSGSGIGTAAALVGAAAAAAVGAAVVSRHDTSSRGPTVEELSITASRDYSADTSLQSTYSELDEAIQRGDWAAVGVTAALLASQSHDEGSTQGSRPRLQKKAPLNPQRAAELDALVEAGDWEGVVAAAARFDAQEALRGESTTFGASSTHSRSHESPSGAGSVGGSSIGTGPSFMSMSGTLESTTSPSTFTAAGNTATSDTASTRSKARKLYEIREEVEALVNAVVPEEADNVDEMMTQFRGREEELVETLRSMQERQVAQKARLESQKQAKRDAKAKAVIKKQQQKMGAMDNTGIPADDNWMAEIEKSDEGAAPASADTATELTTTVVDDAEKENEAKMQLKEAIEKEDWNMVAAAAAGLSGHGIFHDDDEDTRDGAGETASTASGRSLEINALVDRGDWDGVVLAASRYVSADTRKASVTEESTSIEDRRRKRQERLKEEQDALAQAEIWDAIAEQTKAENQEEQEKGSNAGANLAAAWAIDRSLSALRKAETDKSAESDRKSDEGGEV